MSKQLEEEQKSMQDEDDMPYFEWMDALKEKMDIYKPTEREFELVRRYSNNINDRFYAFTGQQAKKEIVLAKFDQIWHHHKAWKKPLYRHSFRRAQHIDSPGQEARRARMGSVRRHNRAQVSFFCRYIIAKKNLKIPLKF